jgi:hypothetical protein
MGIILLVKACGCAVPGILPLQPNLNFNVTVPPLPASLVPLDGQWILSGVNGDRACLVIQESRVSILDITCSSDGRGLVPRIIEQPLIARAGDTISLSVTYNPLIFDSTVARLTFTGSLQIDGGFIGIRRDVATDPAQDAPHDVTVIETETPAILSRRL